MTPQEIALVQNSFEKVAPIAEAAAGLFYGRLFEIDPSTRPLFRGDMKTQGAMLMQTLGMAVRNLHQPGRILSAVQALGRRHVGYGVQDAHYVAVGNALLWTLEKGLAADFTPDTKAAWTQAYGVLSSIMLEASNEIRSVA